MKLSSRRYIGCKTKLLEKIYKAVEERGYGPSYSFADIFAGTGVVGAYFASKGHNVLFNDTLYSNFVIYNAWFGKGLIDQSKIEKILMEFNEVDPTSLEENYFSNIYADKYFSRNDAKKIGFIRDRIEEIKEELSYKEYCYLIASLIYAIDRIANTVGHFESFLKKTPVDKGVILKTLEIPTNSLETEIFQKDANELVREIEYDIVYIDPPYNARQYVNFYHVLENLARWNKPTEFEGNSMKFKRNHLKSDYCRKKAPALFKDLIENLKCKLIVVSYNNTYVANSISSVNMISEEQLIETLEAKGKLTIIELDHKFFNAGKTDFKNHKELLYICEVGK